MNSEIEIDVAVVGGGPAGVAAAAAVVASGACRVVLIESGGQLGGSVTGAMHRCLCGLYSGEPKSPVDTLNGGVQREVVAEMLRLDPQSVAARPMGLTWVLEFPASAYQIALQKICDKPNIHRMMNTRLIGVRREQTKITAIQVESTVSSNVTRASGPCEVPLESIAAAIPRPPSWAGGPCQGESQWLNIKSVIDCTGSGALLQLLGEDVMLPADLQRMLGGFSVRLTGLFGDAEMLRLQVPYVLAQAVGAGQLPVEARFTLLHPGPGPGEAICKFAVNPDRFSAGDMQLFAGEIVEFLRDEIDGFSAAVISETSPRALPRDGRRLKGRSIVSESDVMQGRQIAGEAAHAWWPIERWDVLQGPGYAYPPVGVHYDIPSSAVWSSVIENLFAGGLCVSATASAAASLRVSGICLATGELAGRVAAQSESYSG